MKDKLLELIVEVVNFALQILDKIVDKL